MAYDYFYQTVKNALMKDGWIITEDPFRISPDPETEEIEQWIK